MQLLLNIVLFMPLGFLLMRFLRRNIGHTVIVGFLLSLAIELTQLSGFWGIYPCSYRQFDVDDLLTNTLGALVAYGNSGGYINRTSAVISRHKLNVNSPQIFKAFIKILLCDFGRDSGCRFLILH